MARFTWPPSPSYTWPPCDPSSPFCPSSSSAPPASYTRRSSSCASPPPWTWTSAFFSFFLFFLFIACLCVDASPSYLAMTMDLKPRPRSCPPAPLPPSPPPPSPLLSFLQQLQSAALSSLTYSNTNGSNSSSFDPKTYVDLPLRFPLPLTSAAFLNLTRSANGSLSSETFQQFVKDFFYEAGSDLLPYTPLDYEPEPANFLLNVKDRDIRAWALKLHTLWLPLARVVAPNVEKEPEQHTLLPLPHPMIVPGSRFREIYYWDSYWIIRGLLVSKMFDTARGMVENLLYLVQVHGFVLNGARAYYENRSQPPLLSAMVREVYSETGDVDLLEKALPILLQEQKYWTSDPKQVTILDKEGCKHVLSRYNANWKAPRPESFTIDIQVAEGVQRKKRQSLYHDIASAAESGWDFSSRWMRDQQNLTTLFTSSIVPADLNAYLYQMETNIAYMAGILGNKAITAKFDKAAKARNLAMNVILWNDEMGQWFDYILNQHECEVQSNQSVYVWHQSSQNKIILASNFVPIWCGVLQPGSLKVEKLIHALKNSRLLHSAGIATSLKETGQQWDFPNAWPPLQHMIIEGLAFSGSEKGRKLAKSITQRWIQTNYAVFEKMGYMLEKYDATVCGKTGGGGEYTLQTGFGWSNGVVLSLLKVFGWPLDLPITC